MQRLWIVEHFRVLPTDERYLSLTRHQISVLLNNWLYSLPEDDMKRSFWKEQQDVGPSEKDLAALGYSPEQVKAIKADLHAR